MPKLAKPQLLFWPSNEVATLFGDDVTRYFASAAEGMGLVFAALLVTGYVKQ